MYLEQILETGSAFREMFSVFSFSFFYEHIYVDRL